MGLLPRYSGNSPPWTFMHPRRGTFSSSAPRSEEHTSELQSRRDLVCRLLLEKKNVEQRAPARGIKTYPFPRKDLAPSRTAAFTAPLPFVQALRAAARNL